MTEREKARLALQKMEHVRELRRQQQRLEWEMVRTLTDKAYDQRRPRRQEDVRQTFRPKCSYCGQMFMPGEEILEYVDDDDQVIVRYHYFDEECRRAAERAPGWEGDWWRR